MGPVAATASEVRLASARGRNPRAVRLALLALVLGWTGFVVLLVVGGPGLHPLRDLGLYTALLIGAAALTAARARSTRRAREAWAVLGLGIALLALGDLLGSTLAADRPQHGPLLRSTCSTWASTSAPTSQPG